MKFLTHDGLLYFWRKVKSYVDTGLNSKSSTSHVQALDKGGTGATTAANARTNLGLGAASTYNVDTTPTTNSINLITSGGVKNILDTKSNKSTSTSITLSASSWSGSTVPYSYTISNSSITSSNLIEFLFPSGTSQSVIDAWNNASVGRYTQSNGSVVLYANGIKPTVNITMTMLVRGDL